MASTYEVMEVELDVVEGSDHIPTVLPDEDDLAFEKSSIDDEIESADSAVDRLDEDSPEAFAQEVRLRAAVAADRLIRFEERTRLIEKLRPLAATKLYKLTIPEYDVFLRAEEKAQEKIDGQLLTNQSRLMRQLLPGALETHHKGERILPVIAGALWRKMYPAFFPSEDRIRFLAWQSIHGKGSGAAK